MLWGCLFAILAIGKCKDDILLTFENIGRFLLFPMSIVDSPKMLPWFFPFFRHGILMFNIDSSS
jgi:hypothetical protein